MTPVLDITRWSPHGRALASSIALTLKLIDEHAKTSDAEATALLESLVADLRSRRPMLLLGLPQLDESPAASVQRHIGEDSWYEIGREDGKLRLYLHESAEHDVAVTMTPIDAFRLRADIAAVASGIRGTL